MIRKSKLLKLIRRMLSSMSWPKKKIKMQLIYQWWTIKKWNNNNNNFFKGNSKKKTRETLRKTSINKRKIKLKMIRKIKWNFPNSKRKINRKMQMTITLWLLRNIKWIKKLKICLKKNKNMKKKRLKVMMKNSSLSKMLWVQSKIKLK